MHRTTNIFFNLFIDKSDSHVQLLYLLLLRDLDACWQLSWGNTTLAFLHCELCRATRPDAREIAESLVLLQL